MGDNSACKQHGKKKIAPFCGFIVDGHTGK